MTLQARGDNLIGRVIPKGVTKGYTTAGVNLRDAFLFFAGGRSMRIELNGEPFDCAEGTTLLALIRARGFEPERVAAEVNGEIARRADFGAAELRAGDRVELVHFVGGG